MDALEAEFQKAEEAVKSRAQEVKHFQEELELGGEVLDHPRTRGWFSDVAASAVRGPMRAVTASIDGVAALADKVLEHTGNFGINISSDGVKVFTQSPEEFKAGTSDGVAISSGSGKPTVLTAPSRAAADFIGAPETKTGALTEGVTQFVTGLMGTKKFFKAAEILQGTSKSVTAARLLSESAIASGTAFEGHDGNVANLIESSKAPGGVPDLSNVLTAALETKEDDSELLGRAKNMVTDAGFGILADVLVGGVKAYKAGKQARQAVADDIASEVAGNKVTVDLEREIKFADDVEPGTDVRSPKTGDVVTITPHSPAVDLKLDIKEPGVAKPTQELSLVDDAKPATEAPTVSPQVVQLEATAQKAATIAEDAKTAVEQSKPETPLKDMSDAESYDTLREQLGITKEKLDQIRADVEAGKIGKEDVADLLGFNPSKFNWSRIDDPQSQVALMNTMSRVFDDAMGKAGTGKVSLETIFEQANKIGANADEAINQWKRLQGVEAGVRAQQFTVAASGAHLDRLARKIASGQHSAQDLLDFVVHEKRHALLQVTAAGSRSMIGRALRVMREGVEVREATLKVANGRRLRAERKARDVVKETTETAQVMKEKETTQAVVTKAKETSTVAEQKVKAAKEKVERTQQQIDEANRKRAESRAAAKAERDAKPLTENEMAAAAREFLDKAHADRLEGEQRAAVAEAKAAVKQAEKDAKRAADDVAKAQAEADRAALAFDKKFGNKKPTAEVALNGDTQLQFDEVQNALNNMGLNPDKVVDLAKEIAKRETSIARESASRMGIAMKLQDRVSFLYINNILSGLPTMVVNITSGLTKMVESTFEHYGSASLAKARGDKYAMIAANKAAIATWTSWGTAWQLAGKAWKEGVPQTDILAKAEVEIRGGAGTGPITKVLAAPSRAIVTIDEFFKHIFYQQELNARAVEVAASAAQFQKGARNQQGMFDKVLKETLENPPDDLVLDSIEKSRYQTFQSNLESKLANDLIRLTNNTPITKLIVPFIKTPTNIIKQGIERTPLALLRKQTLDDIRAGTREGNTAAARIALGTALIGITYNLAEQGLMTGSKAGYGKNQNTGDIENIPPYSIKLGDTWYQYNRFDPFGTTLGLTADLQLIAKYRGEANSNDIESDDQGASEAFGNILSVLNKNLLDKTFFKGISDFTSTISNSRSGAEAFGNYVQTVGTNLVPYSSFVKGIARSHDDYAREAFSFSEKLQQQIPGLSTELPQQFDVIGRPIKNADRLGPSWVSPFLVSAGDDDPIAKELASLNMNYSKMDKDIAGVKLTAEQYSKLTETRGKFAYEQLQRWMETGDWQKLTKYQKSDRVRKVLSAGTSRAEAAVLEQWSDLGQHVHNLKVEARSLKNGSLQ